MTGGKRKNPVKTITAVEPKPHYPTAAFTASWPSPSPKKKKRSQIPLDLFISAFGWRSRTKGVLCSLAPDVVFVFLSIFIRFSSSSRWWGLNKPVVWACQIKSENHYTESSLKSVHEDPILFGGPPGVFRFPLQIPYATLHCWITQIL